jgi:hypothetical protein
MWDLSDKSANPHAVAIVLCRDLGVDIFVCAVLLSAFTFSCVRVYPCILSTGAFA